jgi:hypothetical protein
MDLQLRKIAFVQEFLRVNNEKVVDRLEKLLTSEKKRLYKKDLSPFTQEEFEKMITKSEQDLKNKKYKSSTLLKREINSWI